MNYVSCIAIALLTLILLPENSLALNDYEIVKVNDMSHKAMDRPFSAYSSLELSKLPVDKKTQYHVVLSGDLTKLSIKATVDKIIADVVKKDSEVDEIILGLYSDKELVGQGYDIGQAIWAPSGALGNVTSTIARSNNRTGYETTLELRDDLEKYLTERNSPSQRFGLSELKRRELFKAVVEVERKATEQAEKKYPNDFTKEAEYNQELMDKYRAGIYRQYGITRDQGGWITQEGVEKQWPME